ncbi:tyrosine-type recombinase/integrase [Actinoplanes sp. NPDC051859]|uniref:tyrosine-type recombinase/integrase n=1 Tax=Actinoplanes sp. NPDC051859 TaxID=3363909 RepID=UPI00378AC0C7
MGSIQDRWWKTVHLGEGKTKKVKTSRFGKGDRYRVRYDGPDGRQLSKSFPDRQKKAAENFLIDVESDKRRGEFVDPAAGKKPFDTFAESWLRTHQFDESSRETTEIRVRKHIIPFFGDGPINTIKPSDVREWDTSLIGVLAVATRSVAFSHLSAIFTAAVDDGLIRKNPCSAKSVTQPQPIPRKVVPWRKSTVAAIRADLPPRYKPMVDVGGGCGARQGEIFGVAPDDFDFEGGWLHIRRQVKRVRSRLVFGLPKNDKERRTPLPASVGRAIQAHMAVCEPVTVTLPWEDPFRGEPTTVQLVFTTARKNAVNRSTFNEQCWHPALMAAGLERGRHNGMHALRHLFASALLDAGENIKAISEWLGHSDPAFTLRVYTHLMHSSQGRARHALDQVFGDLDGPGLAQS